MENVKNIDDARVEKPSLSAAKKAIEDEKAARVTEGRKRFAEICEELNLALGAKPHFLPDGRIAAQPLLQALDSTED